LGQTLALGATQIAISVIVNASIVVSAGSGRRLPHGTADLGAPASAGFMAACWRGLAVRMAWDSGRR